MFRSYIKIVFRSIAGSKVYFFINVAGLAIGYTVFTLIMLFVLNEFNYDMFNKKADRIYRVVEIQKPPGGQAQQVAITMPALAPALKAECPGVEEAARFTPWQTVLCHYGEKRFYEDGLAFADSSILNIFTFHFIEGNPATALNGPYSIVIDQTIARKYFGNEDPLAKFITVDAGLNQNSFQVTGVIRDFPLNSHLTFTMIASFKALERRWEYFNGWGQNIVVTYLLLSRKSDPLEIEGKIPAILNPNLPANMAMVTQMYLQPLKRIHLHSNRILYQVNNDKGNAGQVRLFSLIALFVIALASINFINLTTARSAIRTREVGIRKLLGSHHSRLVYQFIGESIVVSIIGVLLSFPLVQAMVPTFNNIIGGRIFIHYNDQVPFLLMLILISIVVGFVAGLYPAFYLSAFRPMELLRGKFSSSRSGITLRKALIALQFTIAVCLVTGTVIAASQMEYMYHKPLGFDKNALIYVPLRDAQSRAEIQLLRQRLLRDPRILDVSAGERTGAGATQGVVSLLGRGSQIHLMVRGSHVDYDYLKTMGMTLARGRDFSIDFPSDSSSVIINETLARLAGWKNALGKEIQIANGAVYHVIGVVKDFNYSSLKDKVNPIVMWLKPSQCQFLLLRIVSGDAHTTLSFIKRVWNQTLPAHPFEYGFVDKYIENQYGSDQQNEQLLALFSFVSIAIACLGLFGLTLHTTEQRVKEIGVRKVLGASVYKIVFMLSQESIKLVGISCVVAWPVAYFFMNRWLQNFQYRISIGIWAFAASGFIVFLIAIFTLSFLAVRAGLSNPADSLRYE